MISRIRLETGLLDALASALPFSGRKQKFAEKLKKFFGAEEIILFSSGRSAIYFLLKAMPQKKVFIPAYTCAVVKEAVLLAGKEPVELDIELETFSFSAETLAKKIVPNSIVLATHQFGIPCKIEKIKRVCEKNNCALIEDNAAAFGTKTSGKLTGTFGSAAILSFDYTKTLACARGGAIIFNDSALAEKTKQEIARQKFSKNLGIKNFFYSAAYNLLASPFVYGFFTLPLVSRNSLFADKGQIGKKLSKEYLSEFSGFQARLGLRVLSRMEKTIEKRKRLALFFQKTLSGTSLKIPKKESLQDAVLIRFPIIIPTSRKIAFYEYCRAKGIDLGFSFSYELSKGKCPNAAIAAERTLDLPFYSGLSKREMQKIVKVTGEVSEKIGFVELFEKAVNNPKPMKILAAIEKKANGETIGIAGIARRYLLPSFFVSVREDFQRKGIGTELTKEFLGNFPKKYAFALLSTENEVAKSIYLKSGFGIIGKKGNRAVMVFENRKTLSSRVIISALKLFLQR